MSGTFPVCLQAIPASEVQADSASRLVEVALESEEATTDAIHTIYDRAHEEKVWAIRDAFTWFINEQVEEIAVAKENLDRARLTGDSGAALLEFDREIAAKAGTPLPLPAGARTVADG